MKTVLENRLFRSKESATMHATRIRSGLAGFGGTPYVRAAFAAIVLLTAAAPRLCLAEPQSQATFASPEDASRALVGAVGRQDERAMTQILGGGKALISAEDTAADALDRQYFVQKYREMHRWARKHGGPVTLYIGAENWPFPVPLVFDNGVWRFNSSAGSEEILFRRIGENEVVAIGMCRSLHTGDSPSATHTKGQPPATTRLSNAAMTHQPILFHGYYFHSLAASDGGLAAIAYPAVYRSSGVMSFIVTEEGGLSEKDLGPGTAKLAAAMSKYQSDDTWTPVDPSALGQ
jgi:hypothetical protein